MSFQFAWVGPSETSFGPEHAREDEEVFAFEIEHTEGDFATLALEIRNPRRRLLEGTDIWAWLAHDATPLFFGRLVAVPEDLAGEIVRMTFIARPADYEARKRALAGTLKVPPHWDPVWLKDERIDDPDVVLEARTQLWHIDRVTHDVTVSDILSGEDGIVAFGPDDHDHASLDVSYGAPPVRRVRVEAEVSWDQAAAGTMAISRELAQAFHAAGSAGQGRISSFTGQGLEADWPDAGASLNGGWSIATSTLQRADGVWIDPRHVDVETGGAGTSVNDPGEAAEAFIEPPWIARFYLWEFRPVFVLGYDVSRARIETVSFTMRADVQRVFSEPGEEDEIVIGLASRKVSEVPPGGTTAPIGDARRRSYLKTDRGRQSLDYLVALARAKLLARARAVEIRIDVPLDRALDLSCRKAMALTDPRLPGGSASGKVIGYVLRADGEGRRMAEIRMGCTIGMGATVTAAPGTPTYANEGYVDDGYQWRDGQTVMPIAGEVTYGDISGVPVVDDGIDLLRVEPGAMVRRLEVINGEGAQRDVLKDRFADIPAAVEALNAAHTEVWLELLPLTGGPFETRLDLALSDLMVPRTIEL